MLDMKGRRVNPKHFRLGNCMLSLRGKMTFPEEKFPRNRPGGPSLPVRVTLNI